MGKKGGGKSFHKNKNKGTDDAKTSSRSQQYRFSAEDMDDEIDSFHKQRDFIPLDATGDTEESDDDDEIPVFNTKDINGSDSEDEDEDEYEDEDDDDEYGDDTNDDVAKMIRQRKYLRAKFGSGEDDMQEDDEEDEEDYKLTLGGRKFSHGADNRNFELQSSDDEALKEEEELAIQIRREKAKHLTMEDYDLVDISKDEDGEKLISKDASDKGMEIVNSPDRDICLTVDELNSMSKEKQMNLLYRSAPELAHWFSELNEAHDELECKTNPFLSKVKNGELDMEGGARYFELKQLLLLSYCQAIVFCILLKSEGQPVRGHPVIARLEEIKDLLDQMKQLDTKLPFKLEDILRESNELAKVVRSDNENVPGKTKSHTKIQEQPLFSDDKREEAVPQKVVETQKLQSLKDNVQKARKDKHQKDHIGVQSLEMLKVRASLEEKLKQKGLYSSVAPKPSSSLKRSRPVNGQLETYDDFVDDSADVKGATSLVNGSNKVSQYLNALKKAKVVSGDDDLPKRDDIGERRRKHELRVLSGAGIKTEDDDGDDVDEVGGPISDEDADEEDDVESGDSENEFYKQVEQQRAAKLSAKAQTYSRKSVVPSEPETVEGKRYISSQIMKNRGLTRNRNKAKKNPRKNYKLKHQKAIKNRQGQVRNIKKPSGPYGGETTGINPNVSRSIRFKS